MIAGEQDLGPEIADVNHHDSHVWIRFEDGQCVRLTAKQVLEAARQEEQLQRDKQPTKSD